MKVSIITTVDHNVGDDFVREGIKFLIKQYYKDDDIHFQNIHKHSPITARYGFERIRFNKFRVSNLIDMIIPLSWGHDRVMEADVVIQSGAPVYWCNDTIHCYNNEWYDPLITNRYLRNKSRAKNKNVKLLNLAAGTCQKYHSLGNEFCDRCYSYMKNFYRVSDVTTVRDALAKDIFSKIGIDVPILPCTSIFAVDEHKLKSEGDDYVVLNYMNGGAHYTFGQNIDIQKWEDVFKKFYYYLKKNENVIISCHNQKEVDDALLIDPDAEIFYKKDDYLAYMKFYRKAKFGIMNRVHGAFLMASYGKPSIVIGNDTRAKMVQELGLNCFFVNDVDYDLLIHEYHSLIEKTKTYAKYFDELKNNAFTEYMKFFSKM
jgi:hypothetical protein